MDEVQEFRSLPRVTSDCIPFRDQGRLLLCGECGAAQAPIDEQCLAEIREIYSNYAAYHQSGGAEQYVLDPATGTLRQRSRVLVDHLWSVPEFPWSGRLLDVGCGTGGTLRVFSERGGWRLYGLEIDSRNELALVAIAGFETLYTGEPANLPGVFELVTMVHALEHFTDPLAFLRAMRSKIAPGGRLFIQVPNAAANPFSYVTADHLSHFSAATLRVLATCAGFDVDCVETSWVTKELSLVARPAVSVVVSPHGASESLRHVRSQIMWLDRFIETARAAQAATDSFGVFGTSVAATWLCGALGEPPSFFVDEDPSRIGRSHMGRPILCPAQVPSGSVVFLALAPQIAHHVAERLSTSSMQLRLPPP